MRDTADRFIRDVGRRIAELRRVRGWTQQELADKLRIDVSAVQRLERGVHGCTLDTLWRLAKALRCEPMQLLVPPIAGSARPGRPPRERAGPVDVLFATVSRRPTK